MGANLRILRTPNRTYETLDCKAASISQLLYELQFENYVFNAYQSNAGFYEFGVTSPDYAEILVGEQFAFRTYDQTSDNHIEIIGTVTSLNVQLVTIDVPYSGSNIFIDGGIRRLTPSPTYTDYRIVYRLEDLNDLNYIYTPDIYGYLYVNLGRVIEPILVSRSETYNYLNISYQEYFDGGSNTKQFFTKTLATLSERQLQSLLGANLWELMPKVDNSPTYPVGKLLTKFETKELTKWTGWKRTSSALIDPDIGTRLTGQPQWIFRNVDINGVDQGLNTSMAISDTPPRIDTQELPESTSSFIEVYMRDFTTLDTITERMLYRVEDECINPVMLEWLNEDGATEQFLFSINQVILDTVEEGLRYKRPITQDIETVQRTKFRQVDRWVQRMTLQQDHMTADQIDALHDIKRSDFVRVWLTKDGSEWIGVVAVSDFDDVIRTRHELHSFNVTIEFPDNFDFYNAKKY